MCRPQHGARHRDNSLLRVCERLNCPRPSVLVGVDDGERSRALRHHSGAGQVSDLRYRNWIEAKNEHKREGNTFHHVLTLP
jgi:hypothetical protein